MSPFFIFVPLFDWIKLLLDSNALLCITLDAESLTKYYTIISINASKINKILKFLQNKQKKKGTAKSCVSKIMQNEQKRNTETKAIRMEKELIEKITKLAKENQRDFTKQVNFILKQYLNLLENR